MSSKYRKDITYEDFNSAKHFKWLLLRITKPEHRRVRHFCPLWRVEKGLWVVDRLKEYTASVVFITVAELRRIAKTMKIPEGQLVQLLGKFSMLALPTSQKEGPRRWVTTEGQQFFGFDKRLTPEGRIGRDPNKLPQSKKTPATLPGQSPGEEERKPYYRLDGTLYFRDKKNVYDENGVYAFKNQTGYA
jgi:hypothetical protein